MIQRVQTIWLLLASAFILALFLFPYAQFSDASGVAHALKVSGSFVHLQDQQVSKESDWIGMVIAGILAVFPLFIIVKFNNRTLQLQLIKLLAGLLVAFGCWLLYRMNQAFKEAEIPMEPSQIGFGLYLLLISLVFLWMAANGVKKDIRLLKSADRLR